MGEFPLGLFWSNPQECYCKFLLQNLVDEFFEQKENGNWEAIALESVNAKINDDWRIFGRAAADDKAPI